MWLWEWYFRYMNNLGIHTQIIYTEFLQQEFDQGVPASRRTQFITQLEVTRLLLDHGKKFAHGNNDWDSINRAIRQIESMQAVLEEEQKMSPYFLQ